MTDLGIEYRVCEWGTWRGKVVDGRIYTGGRIPASRAETEQGQEREVVGGDGAPIGGTGVQLCSFGDWRRVMGPILSNGRMGPGIIGLKGVE